jgi:hypothetical protein
MKTTSTPMKFRMLVAPLAVTLALSAGGASPGAFAQGAPEYFQAQSDRAFGQQELDQMLAPIALYPDSLLSQILMAATYPVEVVQAARWSRAYPHLKGDTALRAVDDEDWDPSVKSLVAFPQILAMMDERLDWTQRLGDAFLAQEPQVMDSIQALRQRAQAAGNLRSTEQIYVEQRGPIIVVEPVNPQIVYVPYYDPLVIYGSWWWPAPPVAWRPWPGYYSRPGVQVGFFWGSGISLSANYFFGRFDWRERRVFVSPVYNRYNSVIVNRAGPSGRDARFQGDSVRWRHDPQRRGGVPYRDASVRQQFMSQSQRPAADQRREPRQAQFPSSRVDTQRDQTRTGANRFRAETQRDEPWRTESQRIEVPRPDPQRAAPAREAEQPRANPERQRGPRDQAGDRGDRDGSNGPRFRTESRAAVQPSASVVAPAVVSPPAPQMRMEAPRVERQARPEPAARVERQARPEPQREQPPRRAERPREQAAPVQRAEPPQAQVRPPEVRREAPAPAQEARPGRGGGQREGRHQREARNPGAAPS